MIIRQSLNRINATIDDVYDLRAPSRFSAIEGLRALAVLMVFHVHFLGVYLNDQYFSVPGSPRDILVRMMGAGHLGMDLFFIISGFLIYRSLVKGKPGPVTFFYHRASRLLPAHFGALLVIAFAGFALKPFLWNLTFLAGVFGQYPIVNYVTWSLSWEWIFYILIFALCFVAARQRYRFIPLMVLACTVLNFVIIRYWDAALIQRFNFHMPKPGRFTAFLMGVLVAHAELNYSDFLRRHTRAIGIVGFLGLLGIPFHQWLWVTHSGWILSTPTREDGFYLSAALAMSLLLLALITSDGWVTRAFKFKPVRIVGQVSYSFYLLHAQVGLALADRMGPRATTFGGIWTHDLRALAVTFILSSFFYYYLEKPYFERKALKAAGRAAAPPGPARHKGKEGSPAPAEKHKPQPAGVR